LKNSDNWFGFAFNLASRFHITVNCKKMVSETHCKKIKSYQILTVLFVVPCMIEQCIGVVAAAGQK